MLIANYYIELGKDLGVATLGYMLIIALIFRLIAVVIFLKENIYYRKRDKEISKIRSNSYLTQPLLDKHEIAIKKKYDELLEPIERNRQLALLMSSFRLKE